VGDASNYEEMISLIKLKQPDIIFVQVNRTSLEAIELIGAIKEVGLQRELVAIGDCDDKLYVNNVLQAGALDYIERKSLHQDKLIEKLSNYRVVLSQKNKDIIKDNNEINRDIMLAAQSQVLKELLFGRRSEVQLNQNVLKLFGVNFPHDSFVVLMSRIHNSNDAISEKSTLRFFQEIVEEDGVVYICNSSLNELSFIYNFKVTSQKEQNYFTNKMASKILAIMKEYYQVNANIYISSLQKDIKSIPIAYIQCCHAFKMKNSVSSSQFIYFDNIETELSNKAYRSLDQYVEQLDMALKSADETKIKHVISSFVQDISYIELSQLKYTLSAITYIINDYVERIGIESGEIWGKDVKPYVIIEQVESKGDFIEFIQRIGEQLLTTVKKNEESNIYIKKMKDYVKIHYSEEVNMKKVASDIGITISYMSALFKKYTGQTYKDYLISYRLLKAKELLSKTTLQVAEISQKVGYENEHYFSKIFKIKTGITPSQYRNRNFK